MRELTKELIQKCKTYTLGPKSFRAQDISFEILGLKIEVISYATRELQLDANSLKTFGDFQTANIERLSEAVKGMSKEEAIEYLEGVIRGFTFEIWERKEKSFAASVLQNQIKNQVEKEKRNILPEYNPANLSKVTRKIKEGKDKNVAGLVKTLGISEFEAENLIKNMVSDTFKKGLGNSSVPIETSFKDCPKCKAFNRASSLECMICGGNLRVCDYCKEISTSKESGTCENHKDESPRK